MKINIKIITTLLVCWFFITAQNCSQSQKTSTVETDDKQTEKVLIDIDTETFKNQYAKHESAILLDVRTPQEVAEGYIKGAKNIDFYSESFDDRIKALDKSQAIYIYCRSGGRSSQAMEKMKEMGFREVYNLVGGFNGWKIAGNDVLIPTK